MKKFKALGILISLLGIGAVIIPTGGAAFFYGPTEVSESHPGYLEYDPVRENHIFNDQYDFVYAGQEFYDVYFAAQICVTPGITNEIITKNNTVSSTTFTTTNPTYGNYNYPQLGYFGDVKNPTYYKVIENTTSVTTSELTDIGKPECYIWDNSDYRINFIGWSLTPASCYANCYHTGNEWFGEDHEIYWPTNSQFSFQNAKGSHSGGSDNEITQYIQLPGYSPYDESFEVFSANTLLSNYSAYAKDVDGDGAANEIVVYPIYSSSGKNYSAHNIGQTDKYKDAVTITMDGDSGFSDTMLYDGTLSSTINNHKTNNNIDVIDVFRYSNINVTGNISFNIDVNTSQSSWQEDVPRYTISGSTYGTGNPSLSNGVGNNIRGYFNIYLVLSVAQNTTNDLDECSFVQDDVSRVIDAITENNQITPYFVSLSSERYSYDWWEWIRYHYDYRSAILIYERLYEPHLIGGPTGGMTYQEGQTYAEDSGHEFVRFSSNGNNNVYRMMNVPLDGSITNNYSSQTGVDVKASSQWFAIQAASDASLTYPMGLVDDSNINTLPVVTVNGQTEYFYSETYLKNLQGYLNQETKTDLPTINGSSATESSTFPLLHVNDPGNYDIEIHINLEDFAAGSTTPAGISSIDIYLHKRVVHFINIIENTLDSIIENTDYYREDDGLKNYLKTDSDHYAYRCDQFREGEYLSGDTLFYKSGTLSNTITFRSLLGEYENLGYALMDIVTGRIFTADNVDTDPFLVDRSCILVYIPLSNLQKGEEIR